MGRCGVTKSRGVCLALGPGLAAKMVTPLTESMAQKSQYSLQQLWQAFWELRTTKRETISTCSFGGFMTTTFAPTRRLSPMAIALECLGAVLFGIQNAG